MLSNGFSIVEYGNGIDEVDLQKVEKTWDGKEGRFVHHIGPLREGLGGDRKASYRLVGAEVVVGVGLRQVYLQKASTGENGNDRVLELLWLF